MSNALTFPHGGEIFSERGIFLRLRGTKVLKEITSLNFHSGLFSSSATEYFFSGMRLKLNEIHKTDENGRYDASAKIGKLFCVSGK